jgi:hypothetical protein
MTRECIRIINQTDIPKDVLWRYCIAAMTPTVRQRLDEVAAKGRRWHITFVRADHRIRAKGAPLGLAGGVTRKWRRNITVTAYDFRERASAGSGDAWAKQGYLTDTGRMNGEELTIHTLAHEIYHAFAADMKSSGWPAEHAADVYALSRVEAWNDEPFAAVKRR